MAQNQLGMIAGRVSAVRRLAQALLRQFGGAQVTLRLADPASGDTNSQLGLEPPSQEEFQISPVLVKALPPTLDGKRRIEVAIGQTALQAIAKTYGVEDIAAWLRSGFEGVVWDDQLLRVESVSADKFLAGDCLFHITATE